MADPNGPIVELKNIVKRFGSVEALTGVSMTVRKGEVLGLLGDNGAGKSTLVKTLAGVHAPTSGEIWVKGVQREAWSPLAARNAGIETVFQDRALSPQHSIVANIFMGREITNSLGLINVRKQMDEANRLMREIGFTSKVFNPNSIVGNLSGGERQGVAIARALYNEADVIVLDEPTTALSLTETQKVFRFVEAVKESGRTVIFIGHNIYHVWDISDRFFVIDRGKEAFEGPKSAFEGADHLIHMMHDLAETGRVDQTSLRKSA
ncbi:MAG: sugar ABC transporter ATP-binding protein [Marivivens sp.]|jgi:simple sugar transport system ATP-binding protein|nr:sugar ABC transporter ATP-binding protein [Marivivens sp.]